MWNIVYSSWWIWASLIIIVILVVLYFYNTRPKFIIPNKYLNSSNNTLFRIVSCLLIICIVILPLNLQIITGKRVVIEKYIPVQVLFDVSLSMTADDIEPSRFVAAKYAVTQLMKKLEWYNISVIIFSGIPFVYIPFSDHTEAMVKKWDKTNLWDFPPTPEFVGTAIWDAMLLWVNNLEKVKAKSHGQPWIIILLTDGDSNKWYDPDQVIPIAKKKNIPVFALWMWEQDYVVGYDHWWNQVRTSINVPLLENIAWDTWWEFYRVLENSSFEDIFHRISEMIRSQEKDRVENTYLDINKYILIIMFLCLVYLIYIRIISLKK